MLTDNVEGRIVMPTDLKLAGHGVILRVDHFEVSTVQGGGRLDLE